ncbi:YciI family protein [Pseudalkalibacillus berkeleyi]|uniref:YciI family protein n=1 Tax=Pseudalkalibacillus berkeleyi TaxID=1069813 RepID=A0ABS9H0I7_9BACL|nr:YciI family protein [Pseudalkalibacillus berkeleyi]MCF6137531.1 YciI family protein [Pseudalkalibacillus berkeleyi]
MGEYLYKLIPYRKDFIDTITAEENQILSEHYSYLEQLLETKELVLAGPCLDGSLGIVILRTQSFERAESLMNEDPSVVKGVMSASLHPYRVSLMQSE